LLLRHLREAPRFSVLKRPTNLGSSGLVCCKGLSAVCRCLTVTGVELTDGSLHSTASDTSTAITQQSGTRQHGCLIFPSFLAGFISRKRMFAPAPTTLTVPSATVPSRTVPLRKSSLNHPQGKRRPHVKFGPSLLKTVALHKECRNRHTDTFAVIDKIQVNLC